MVDGVQNTAHELLHLANGTFNAKARVLLGSNRDEEAFFTLLEKAGPIKRSSFCQDRAGTLTFSTLNSETAIVYQDRLGTNVRRADQNAP